MCVTLNVTSTNYPCKTFFLHVSLYDTGRVAHVAGLEAFFEKDFYCGISNGNVNMDTITTVDAPLFTV